MFEKNSFSVGLILGIVIPIIAYPVFYGLFTGLENMNFMSDAGFRPLFKLRTTAILAIALNVIILNKFQKRKATQSMRGVVISTFVYVMVWLFVFWKTIM